MTESSGWPGWTQTGSSTAAPLAVVRRTTRAWFLPLSTGVPSNMSPESLAPGSKRPGSSRPSRSAVRGETRATGSQVTLVTGCGASCIHDTLENAPSYNVGLVRVTSSMPPSTGGTSRPRSAAPSAGAERGEPGAGDEPVVERRPPGRLEVAREHAAEPLAEQVVAGVVAAGGQRVEDLQVRVRVGEERLDERLDDGERAVVGPGVAPLLEVVGARDVPGGALARLVAVEADVDRGGHARERLLEAQLGRQRVDRVRAQHHQRPDLAGGHVAYQRRQPGPDGLDRPLARREVLDHAGAEAAVEGRGERVDLGRLRRAGHEHGAAVRRPYVLDDGVDERLGRAAEHAPGAGREPQALGDGGGRERDRAGLDRQPVVGHAARHGHRRLDDVHPRHRAALVDAAAGRVLAVVPDRVGVLAAQEVGVERDDDLGVGEPSERPGRLAERGLGPERLGVVEVGAQRDPLGAGGGDVAVAERVDGGRGRGLGQDHDAPAALAEPAGLGHERAPVGAGRGGVAARGDGPAAVGVVELEHRRLGEDVGVALGDRVLGVALDLGRPALVALHQDRVPDAAQRHRGGVVVRDARDHLFGLAGVRQDRLDGPAAAGHAGERGARAHDLEERPAAGAGVGRRHGVLELAGRRRAGPPGAAPPGGRLAGHGLGVFVGRDVGGAQDVELNHSGLNVESSSVEG